MAVSLAVGWAIFSPFSILDNLDSFSFARLETIDLFSIFVPLSVFMTIVNRTGVVSRYLFAGLIVVAIALTLFSLVAGLFVLEKMGRKSPLKRMAICGIIMPFGIALTIGWFLIPIWAYSYSVLYSMPSILLVAGVAAMIRMLSGWVCAQGSTVG